ncbi:MAG: AraC family ligand binding domain-containing protein, partial [Victivallaceae bacterium]|nr:AraC family ligand binding domain-containing protein [Victivallaceae bacterium]
MKNNTLELDNFISPAIGAEVSFHSISWNPGRSQFAIPTGGNLHYHSLPSVGTVEHSHEFGELILILSGSIIHWVNGEKQLLKTNSITFVRPSDRHGFLPAPDSIACE